MQPSTNQPVAPTGVQNTYPGKSLGIAGLILSLTFSGVGLIVSIIAFRQSRQAGFKNGLAQAGIIIGAILTAFGLIFGTVMVILAVSLGNQCHNLGPGSHEVNGATITCTSSGASYDSNPSTSTPSSN